MRNGIDIFSLESTLSAFFECVTKSDQKESAYPYLDAMISIFRGQTSPGVISFDLNVVRMY